MLLKRPPANGFVTRFAPAPTGFLHLGHVASAIAVWGVARAFGGRVLLRLEDHDQVRSRPEYEEAIIEDLHWLGFEPDEAPVRQSDRHSLYRDALHRLHAHGLVYACGCSRKTIERATGPSDGEIRYPGLCRDTPVDSAAEAARRVRMDRCTISFEDLRLGRIEQTPSDQCGDLLARDRLSHWTYQFAVVVDDLDQNVDLVIRGEDLLTSTGRQIQLSELLGRPMPPAFLHHPLIVDATGSKLSKSRGDTAVRELRASGQNVEQVLGAAAVALGLSQGEPVSHLELAARIKDAAVD
ncbi:MAG: glutamate--tRNA ligase family protein [Vicinamibacteria bacterium]